MLTLTNLILAVLLVNAVTFVLFGWDKLMAEAGRWRVSEATLLRWALFGGIGGAYAGRQLFRHKTRKQSFVKSLHKIGLFHVVALTFCAVFFWPTGGGNNWAVAQTVSAKIDRVAFYPNCDFARGAGVAPIRRGDPGYRSELDADDDGKVCEPYGRY